MEAETLELGYNFCLMSPKEKLNTSLCYQPSYDESIRQSIFTILLTATCERPLDPTFGCNMHKFVYARIDQACLNEIINETRVSLARCETRITVTDVTIARESNEPSHLEIHISYRIKKNGVTQSVIVPMVLLE